MERESSVATSSYMVFMVSKKMQRNKYIQCKQACMKLLTVKVRKIGKTRKSSERGAATGCLPLSARKYSSVEQGPYCILLKIRGSIPSNLCHVSLDSLYVDSHHCIVFFLHTFPQAGATWCNLQQMYLTVIERYYCNLQLMAQKLLSLSQLLFNTVSTRLKINKLLPLHYNGY